METVRIAIINNKYYRVSKKVQKFKDRIAWVLELDYIRIDNYELNEFEIVRKEKDWGSDIYNKEILTERDLINLIPKKYYKMILSFYPDFYEFINL